jgi:hypothetical protein
MSIKLVLGSRQERKSENGKQLWSTVMSIFKTPPRKIQRAATIYEYGVLSTRTFSYARLLIPNAGRDAPEGLACPVPLMRKGDAC